MSSLLLSTGVLVLGRFWRTRELAARRAIRWLTPVRTSLMCAAFFSSCRCTCCARISELKMAES